LTELTDTEREILDVIKNPLHSPADAARFLGISRAAITYHLKKMHKRGLVRRRRGVKGAGSYAVTEDGLRLLASRLEDFDGGHQGCLIVAPNNREVHHWDAKFELQTPFTTRFTWDRHSKPPNEHHWWKDDFKREIDGEMIHVPTIRYIEGKRKRSITFFFEAASVDGERTYADVEDMYLRWALKLAAWFTKHHGPQLSLIRWSGAPHYVLGTSPEVALTLMEAGIRTEYVHADNSPRIGQPHVETNKLEYALIDATAPHHIKNLYAKENNTQVMVYKLYERAKHLEATDLHQSHIIESLIGYIEILAESIDKTLDSRDEREMETKRAVTEFLERMQNRDKKRPETDPGDMFR